MAEAPAFSGPSANYQDLSTELFKELQELQNSVVALLSKNMPLNSPESVQLKVTEQLQAHIENAQTSSSAVPVVPCNDPLEELKDNLTLNVSQLDELILHLRSEQDDLKDQLRKGEEMKQQQSDIMNCLTAQNNVEPAANSQAKLLEEWKKKFTEADSLCKTRTQQMFQFISKHYPRPAREEIRTYNKKHGTTIQQNSPETLFSMSDIMEQLMNACLETPNQAYISIDSDKQYWPPYIELLVRYGIALRDPNNQHRIRLTPYHH